MNLLIFINLPQQLISSISSSLFQTSTFPTSSASTIVMSPLCKVYKICILHSCVIARLLLQCIFKSSTVMFSALTFRRLLYLLSYTSHLWFAGIFPISCSVALLKRMYNSLLISSSRESLEVVLFSTIFPKSSSLCSAIILRKAFWNAAFNLLHF